MITAARCAAWASPIADNTASVGTATAAESAKTATGTYHPSLCPLREVVRCGARGTARPDTALVNCRMVLPVAPAPDNNVGAAASERWEQLTRHR
ncbi:hypothetical protein GCM10022233_48280 [Streptomyces shaanxiensis]|uniref:Secreted protein n=1 Tax=Streptomyces shaanxiensis TaxID=653357 RepID=A0ABP7VJQ8_9ACTN